MLKKVPGIINNHWIHCYIELQQPTEYAHYILRKIQKSTNQNKIVLLADNTQLQNELDQFIIFNFGQNYKENLENKDKFTEEVLCKFKYVLELREGNHNIREGQVSSKIALNHTMKLQDDEISMNETSRLNYEQRALQFQLENDGQTFTFAAEDSNIDVYQKWLAQLEQIEMFYSIHQDTFEQKILIIKRIITTLLEQVPEDVSSLCC